MRFLAPELLDGPEEFKTSRASDVYSLSLVLYSAWAHHAPFAEFSNENATAAAARSGVRPLRYLGPIDVLEGFMFGGEMLDGLWMLLNNMWEHDPSKRLLIEEIESKLNTLLVNLGLS